ncbi:MAG: hypothetical protein JWR63_3279 [Conexibacter sp.]|nr:hypothetical protein [Conexibacter sp.]
MHLPLAPQARNAVLLAGAALAIAAPAASADSIVYVDHGNVWTMNGDGTGRVQLTDGGQWHSPTQADDGTIAAVQGTGPIVVMAKDGRQLRTIQTPTAHSGDGGTFAPRPVALSFSPDGSKIAYSYIASSCPVASTCGTIQRSSFFTDANATPNATPIERWGNDYSVSDAEWVTNSRVVNFGGAGSQVNFDDLDDGVDYSHQNWFNHSQDTGDGEISRDGKKLATTFSYDANQTVAFWAVDGDVKTGIPPAAKYGCRMTPAGKHYADPSWSPDSSTVAYQNDDGIYEITFTRLDPNPTDYPGSLGCATAGDERLIVPGGSQPDWGPADPATSRYLPAGTGGDAGTPKPTPAPAPAPVVTRKPAATTVKAGGAATQRFTAGGTLKVTCTASAAGRCSATVRVKAGRATYAASASAPVKAGKAATLKLRFSAKAKAAIRKALRHGRVTATVTVNSGGATASRTVALKR